MSSVVIRNITHLAFVISFEKSIFFKEKENILALVVFLFALISRSFRERQFGVEATV